MAKCKNCKGYNKAFDENDLAVGYWCDCIEDDPDPELERDCKYFQHITNADRIRAMTDEELADYLMNVTMGELLNKKIINVLAWLREESEEST